VVPQPICSYWDIDRAAWDTRGCQYAGEAENSSESVTCICNHLTSFGIIFDWQGEADPQEPGTLSVHICRLENLVLHMSGM
jgi:hypothetical protein